jgi:hypothetical protein
VSGKCEQSDRRGINICGVRHSECHPITGVPPTAWANSIEKHLLSDVDSRGQASLVVETLIHDLLEGDQAESRRNNPASRAFHPTPPVLGGIKSNALV